MPNFLQIYDNGSELQAAQVWWALQAHGAKPLILQGGFAAWADQGGEQELYEPCPLKLCTVFEGSMRPEWLGEGHNVDQGSVTSVPEVNTELCGRIQQRMASGTLSLGQLQELLGLTDLPTRVVFRGGAEAAWVASVWWHLGGGKCAVLEAT